MARPARPVGTAPAALAAPGSTARPAGAAPAPRVPSAGQLPLSQSAGTLAAPPQQQSQWQREQPQPAAPAPKAAPSSTAAAQASEIEEEDSPPAEPAAVGTNAAIEGAASGSGGGGSWGGGWGAFGRLGASLQQAAQTAIKDVTELGESFQQVGNLWAGRERRKAEWWRGSRHALLEESYLHSLQVLQEVAEASDEDEQEGAGQPLRKAPPPEADAPLPPDQEAKRRAVLARLAQEDEEEVAPPPQPRDPQQQGGTGGAEVRCAAGCFWGVQLGQQAAFQHSCMCTAVLRWQPWTRALIYGSCSVLLVLQGGASGGAGKALSSLWGWGATLASKVEAAAATVGREIAGTVQEAQPAVQAASRCAWQGLGGEEVGSTVPHPCMCVHSTKRRSISLSRHLAAAAAAASLTALLPPCLRAAK